MGKSTERKFFKGKNTNVQKQNTHTHEQKLKITCYGGNANQDHIKIPPHSC
jgi:hypothetical protein